MTTLSTRWASRPSVPSPPPEGGADAHSQPGELRALGAPLLAALEAHDPGAQAHADATAGWALAIAVQLELGRERAMLVREAARLHAVGDLYVPAGLLRRPGALNETEREAALQAPEAGHQLLLGAGIAGRPAEWVRCACERVDGTGYPRGLAGEAIPVEARVIAVACAHDELTAERPARRGLDAPAAMAHLRGRAGAELDSRVVEALVGVLTAAHASSGG